MAADADQGILAPTFPDDDVLAADQRVVERHVTFGRREPALVDRQTTLLEQSPRGADRRGDLRTGRQLEHVDLRGSGPVRPGNVRESKLGEGRLGAKNLQ